MTGLIQLVLITLLASHLLVANLATGGPFICLWLQKHAARGDVIAGRLNRQLAGWSVVTLLFAAITGLMQMTLVANLYPNIFQQTVALIKPSRYYASVGELVFSLICLTGYYIMAGKGFAGASAGKRLFAGAVAFLAALNTAWHFPTLFAILGVFSTRPDAWGEPISVMSKVLDGEVAALATHFLLASAAVSGLMLSTLALSGVVVEKGGDVARRYARVGGLIAVVPTVLQLIVGLWLLMETPELARKMLMGQSMQATVIFLMAVVAALMLMHRLASLALGRQKPSGLRNAWMALAVTVWMMSAVQQLMREQLYQLMPHQPQPAAVAPAENPPAEAPPAKPG